MLLCCTTTQSIFLFENIETHENLFVIRALNRYGRKGPAYQSTKCSIAEQRIAARSGICEAARTVDTTLCGHRTVLTTDRRKRSSHRVARAEDQETIEHSTRFSQERINPDQLLLFSTNELKEIADEISSQQENDACASDASEEPNEPDKEELDKKKAKRRKLPSDLPKEIKRYELAQELRKCPCCGELRCEMGVEVSQTLEFQPAIFKVIEHQRVQYACKSCQENVVVAPKPPQPIEKGLPGQGSALR